MILCIHLTPIGINNKPARYILEFVTYKVVQVGLFNHPTG